MNSKEDIITSVQDSNIKAMVSFNDEYEYFTWKGDFEEFKVVLKSCVEYDRVIRDRHF